MSNHPSGSRRLRYGVYRNHPKTSSRSVRAVTHHRMAARRRIIDRIRASVKSVVSA